MARFQRLVNFLRRRETNMKEITFKMFKSICCNWNEEDRRTKMYNQIRCTITNQLCKEDKCPIIKQGD